MATGECTLCSSARGWSGGRNLVYRLYREEGLVLRSHRPRRRKTAVNRTARHRVQGLNEAWSLDFVHDQLSNGQSFRALTTLTSTAVKP
jgi:putative transposase